MRAERDRRQFEQALERVKVLITDGSYREARRLLEALKADAITPQQQESVTRLFKLIFEKEDQNNGFFAGPTQQPAGQPQQGKDQSQQPADQSSGKGGFFDPFFGREAPKPAARPEKADAETKPVPDNKQKKGPKNETNKGYSLNEFDF